VPVCRAFNQFLNLANIAEQYHRIGRRPGGRAVVLSKSVHWASCCNACWLAGHNTQEYPLIRSLRVIIELVLDAPPDRSHAARP